MSKLVDANKKIEEKVVGTYKAVENGVVGAYKKVEDSVVGAYKKVEDKCVESLFAKDGETVEEANFFESAASTPKNPTVSAVNPNFLFRIYLYKNILLINNICYISVVIFH